MPQISLTKLLIFIAAITILCHLNDIGRFIAPVYWWFAESLGFMRNFPEGARAAIAFLTIIWLIMIVCKTINK